jgi:hypothetical protein
MASKTVYQWRDGYRPQSAELDPVKVGRELDRIQKKHGLLTPELVLDSARPLSSPLHAGFEWDDCVAAEKYRLAQAGYLIRAVIMIPTGQPEFPPTRRYVYVQTDAGNGYENVVAAMSDYDLQDQVLLLALRELKAWQAKYKHLKELAAIFDALAEAEAKIAV